MSEREAHAWWAEVEHLRERIEGRPATTASVAALTHAAAPTHESAPRPRRTVVIAGRGAPAPVVPRTLVDARASGAAVPSRSRAAGREAFGGAGQRAFGRASDRVAGRPDRIAMWAVLLGFALMLIATGSASAATSLGERTLKVPMKGRDVRQLQSRLKDAGLLNAAATAYYGPLTRTAVRRYQRSRCLTADGIAGPATLRALLDRAPRCADPGPATADGDGDGADGAGDAGDGVLLSTDGLHRRVVTWYGPGMYGRRTACGDRLTTRLVGVAHRSLPCGTRVRFVHEGRTVVARVVDRGPHTSGVQYDLTWAAARQLRVIAAGRVAVHASR